MLRSVIICPDREISKSLEHSLSGISNIGVLRTLDRYPALLELSRFVRAHAPQLVFLSLESLEQAQSTFAAFESAAPGTQVVAIHKSYDPQLLLEVMRAGMREFVAVPFDRDALLETLERVTENLKKRPVQLETTDLLYSFLPSKAGAGTSTLALNAAVAISKISNTRTFLGDFDLGSGMIRFMMKLTNSYSVVDAAERSADFDENFWPQLVTGIGSLDILHAGKLNPNFRLESVQMRRLIDFARRNYRVICADLSGNLEKYSIEIMHESKRIFLVCTPEIPSLHLTREKYQYLRTLDLGDRVSVLLNRSQKRNVLTPSQIEELLGLPIHMTFPNDYPCVHRALDEGTPLDFASPLGKQCIALAHSMLEQTVEPAPETKKRFIEYFNLSPTRYSLDDKKSNA